MTPRAATLISRTLIGLSLVMIATAVMVSRATLSRADTTQIVVVPSALASRIADSAAVLQRDPTAATDPALADAPQVMRYELDRVAAHERLSTTANSAGAILILAVSLMWMGTGSVIVSRQPRNLAGWVFLGLGFLVVVEGLSQILVFSALKATRRSHPLRPGPSQANTRSTPSRSCPSYGCCSPMVIRPPHGGAGLFAASSSPSGSPCSPTWSPQARSTTTSTWGSCT
jgi:hypothetical protein